MRLMHQYTACQLTAALACAVVPSEKYCRIHGFLLHFALLLAVLAVAAGTVDSARAGEAQHQDLLISNALVVDGSGTEPFTGAVRISGDRIVAIGALEPRAGEQVLDARGLLLAPGFIDTHSHHDSGWEQFREMRAVLTQGITTIVRGADGADGAQEVFGYLSLAEFSADFRRKPAAVNVASFAPHGNLRAAVMGAEHQRPASAEEVRQMSLLLQQELDDGALGLSTGLEYSPGIFSETAEVIALARVAAAAGGRYASHLRDEDDRFLDALDEIIRIGREAGLPVHVSHIKLADKLHWGTTETVLARLDAARNEGIDISADIYPYLHWASSLSVLFPDKDYSDMEAAKFTFQRTTDPQHLLLTSFAPNPELAGLNFAQLAARLETSPEQALLTLSSQSDGYLQRTGKTGDSIIALGMQEGDMLDFMRWHRTNICSDGGHDGAHPRGWGSFPRFLSRYATGENGFSLGSAIAKMTSIAARNTGIHDRGMIRPGYFADLVLIDRGQLQDHASFETPHLPSSGIERVWVNGTLVLEGGTPTGQYPGRLLVRAK